MKRIGVLLGIILLLLSGCSTQKKKLNVSEWMFSEHLNIATVKAVLGAPYDTEETDSSIIYFWKDYEIYPGYKGTLSYQDYSEENESKYIKDTWYWTIDCDKETYQKIDSCVKKQLGDPTHEAKDGLHQNFSAGKLGFDKAINNERNFGCSYENGLFTISWHRVEI